METQEKETLNIYQKLLVIQQKINGLEKDKKSNTYSYVTGNKLLGFVKPIMNDLGLILKQEVLSIDNERMDYKTGIGTQYEKPKSEILSKVMMRFTWIDAVTGEKDENLFGANGQNEWEKGLGSALTYAERYFILKYFHIATDEDDIDNDDRKPKDTVATQPISTKTPTKTTQSPINQEIEKELPVLVKDSADWKKIMDFLAQKVLTRLTQVTKNFTVSDELAIELQGLIDDSLKVKETVEETPKEVKVNSAVRLPALTTDNYNLALKGTKVQILKVLGEFRMRTDQRKALTELANK